MHPNAEVYFHDEESLHCSEIAGCRYSAVQCSREGMLVLKCTAVKLQHSVMGRTLESIVGSHAATHSSYQNLLLRPVKELSMMSTEDNVDETYRNHFKDYFQRCQCTSKVTNETASFHPT